MKVVLKAERDGRHFAGRLDFLVLRMLDQVGLQLARRLGLSKEQAERDLSTLMKQTESWVAERHPRGQAGAVLAKAAPEMSQEEREEALAFLQRPDLVQQILADMAALGYVGEEKPKLLAYLIGISRKLEEPLAGIIISQASAGKSGLTELIEKLTPEEEVVLYSRITAQAISNHERTALKRKLLILAEKAGGGDSADYQIRELLSRQKFITAVPEKDPVTGLIQTQVKQVEGPISYLETTANPNLNHENATRCFEIELDESMEQTLRIHEAQKDRYRLDKRKKLDTAGIQRRHQNAQRLLKVTAVIIPYVDHIRFPHRWLRTRRDHKRFLCLIEAAAFCTSSSARAVFSLMGPLTSKRVWRTIGWRTSWPDRCCGPRSTSSRAARATSGSWCCPGPRARRADASRTSASPAGTSARWWTGPIGGCWTRSRSFRRWSISSWPAATRGAPTSIACWRPPALPPARCTT